MPDIFDEVADDLRAERTRKFMIRYAGAFVTAAGLVLIGIGGWKTWQWYQHRQQVHAATQYAALTGRIGAAGPGLTKAGDTKDAQALLGFAAHAPAGYATLARFRAAALYAQAGNLKAATSLWSQLGATGSVAGPLLRGLANLTWAQHEMGVAPDATVRARLQPLTDPSNPWHDMAQIDVAVLDMQAGQSGPAKSLLQRVDSDPAAPANLRNLAEGLIAKLNG